MSKDGASSGWNILKGSLKQIYAELAADGTAYTEGHEDELVGRLQKKTGRSEQEIRRILAEARENNSL